MITKILLLAGCAALMCTPVFADDDDDDDDDDKKIAVCHRTGNAPKGNGLFQGQILQVEQESLSMHISRHSDVVIPPKLLVRFGSSRVCKTNAAGALFDSTGKPILPTTRHDSGGGHSGPG